MHSDFWHFRVLLVWLLIFTKKSNQLFNWYLTKYSYVYAKTMYDYLKVLNQLIELTFGRFIKMSNTK